MTTNVLYALFILAFIVHDGEELAVQHKWVMEHGEALCAKLPKLRLLFNHIRKLNTKAFAIAVFEELVLLMAITAYALIDGPYSAELWSAAFMAFSVHLIVHVIQAIVVRGYVPGLVLSILLLPFSYLGMQSICNTFNVSQLLLYGMVGVGLMLANLAVVHWFGLKMANL